MGTDIGYAATDDTAHGRQPCGFSTGTAIAYAATPCPWHRLCYTMSGTGIGCTALSAYDTDLSAYACPRPCPVLS
eukprot:93428-Rhodomonas_salina.3